MRKEAVEKGAGVTVAAVLAGVGMVVEALVGAAKEEGVLVKVGLAAHLEVRGAHVASTLV